MSTPIIPTVTEYNSAKAIVMLYESEQRRLYEIRLRAFHADLVNYFKNNLIDGQYELKEFNLGHDSFGGKIIPVNPRMDENYDGGNDEDIQALCKKHDVKFSFPGWVYHK